MSEIVSGTVFGDLEGFDPFNFDTEAVKQSFAQNDARFGITRKHKTGYVVRFPGTTNGDRARVIFQAVRAAAVPPQIELEGDRQFDLIWQAQVLEWRALLFAHKFLHVFQNPISHLNVPKESIVHLEAISELDKWTAELATVGHGYLQRYCRGKHKPCPPDAVGIFGELLVTDAKEVMRWACRDSSPSQLYEPYPGEQPKRRGQQKDRLLLAINWNRFLAGKLDKNQEQQITQALGKKLDFSWNWRNALVCSIFPHSRERKIRRYWQPFREAWTEFLRLPYPIVRQGGQVFQIGERGKRTPLNYRLSTDETRIVSDLSSEPCANLESFGG